MAEKVRQEEMARLAAAEKLDSAGPLGDSKMNDQFSDGTVFLRIRLLGHQPFSLKGVYLREF